MVSVSNIGSDVQQLRIAVTMPELGAERTYELIASGPEQSHIIAAIPVGAVQVQVFAEGASGVVATGARGGLVVPDQQTIVEVPLLEGGPGAPFSTTMVVEFGAIRPGSQSPLEAAKSTPPDDWSALKELIQQRFSEDALLVRATMATLRLDSGASHEVEKLQDLWRGTVTLSVSQGDSEAVASARLGEDSATLDLVPTVDNLAAAFNTNSPAPQWTLSGDPAGNSEPDHVGYVRATVTVQVSRQ